MGGGLLWLLVTIIAMENATQGEAPGRFLISSWQSENGLPGNVVRSVRQAADGYVWVATAEGTVRFDGVRFTGFEAEPDATLARLPPRALFTMPNGDVWIATVRGGLLHWHDRRLRSVWTDTADGTPVSQIAALDEGVLIVRGDELWRARSGAAPAQVERLPAFDALLRAGAETAARDGRAPGGATLGMNPLRLEDSRGRVWSTTPEGKLTVTGGQPGSEIALPELDEGSRINELHEDREGNIWLATGESGLVQIRERRVEVLTSEQGLSDKTARVLLEDAAGALWIGGNRGGLDRVENGSVTHFEVGDARIGRPVTALCKDASGTLWAATRDGSVFRWEDGAFSAFLSGPGGVTKVRAIVQDTKGRMWFGGVQGLAMWSEGTLRKYGVAEGFDAVEVTALAAGAAESLWIGTGNGEVWRTKDGRFDREGISERAEERPISAFLPDQDGSLWAATLGAGLLHFRDGRMSRFDSACGLPDLRLTSVLDDGLGNLWLGSLGGIFRVSKAELSSSEADERAKISWLKLDRSDGLLSRECSGGSQPAGWRGRDGRIWFPMLRGVAAIRPAELALNAVPPPVVIESAHANGDTFAAGTLLQAGPGRSRLEFRYTALSFAAPEKVRFQLRLHGLEDDWREGTLERIATYQAVPPGRYRFQVIAANGDGVWNESGAFVDVEVLPHFWETGWFRAVVAFAAAAAAVGAGWAIARARLRRRLAALELRHAREAERSRIARDLHDDLGASLTEISMLAHLAVEDGAASNAMRQPLTQIASKAQSLVGALDEIVWAVNPRQDTVVSLIDYLAAFAREFLGAAGIALRLDVSRELPAITLDSERRHGLFLAVREVLNNAVRHSAATEVFLQLRVTNDLEIIVRDNGRGFDPGSRSEGDGLPNICERLRGLGGVCRIESSSGSGTSVLLTLPLPAAETA
jgi:signal transduction histidine kinase/ligand-binding sensor domain-containing protein